MRGLSLAGTAELLFATIFAKFSVADTELVSMAAGLNLEALSWALLVLLMS